jgi:hypothetical protein
MSEQNLRPVIVCTVHKGVFFGYAADTSGRDVKLKDSRMAIYWGTDRGVMQLAATGPTSRSKMSVAADSDIRDVTAVFEVKPEALKAWEALS